MTLWKRLLALFIAVPSLALAQQPAAPMASLQPATGGDPVGLSLGAAVASALAKNPDYQKWLNNEGPASLTLTSAYASFIPGASVSGGFNYTGSGSSNFGGTNIVKSSPSLGSNYSVDLSWALDGRLLTGPGQSRANLHATQEQIEAAKVQLRVAVVTQYLNVLQTGAQIDVVTKQVGRNQVFLDLAKAKYQVGQSTQLDVRQAEVALGQSKVDLLVARQQNADARLELYRLMGIPAPTGFEQVALTDTFPVVQPAYVLDDLLQLAAEGNPNLRAAEASSDASVWDLRAAKSEYFPSLRVSANWSGFTQQYTDKGLLISQATGRAIGVRDNCTFQNQIIQGLTYGPGGLPGQPNGGIIPDCNAFSGLDASGVALAPSVSQGILTANNSFPFSFTKQPFQVFASISLPIFNGLQREVRVSQAKARRDDAKEQVRAQALLVRTQVTSRYLAVGTAYEGIGVAQENRVAAADQLRLAQDRYRLGQGTALELSDAESAVQRAEGTYVDAVYGYHKAVAALEEAVGRPLR